MDLKKQQKTSLILHFKVLYNTSQNSLIHTLMGGASLQSANQRLTAAAADWLLQNHDCNMNFTKNLPEPARLKIKRSDAQ